MKILIIEDDIFFTKKLNEVFSKHGIATSVSLNAEEALMKIKSNIFDIILLDLTLPNMSGREFLQALRGSKDNTPVIVLSATDSINRKNEMLLDGADDYIIKPCHASELYSRIKAVVRRSNYKTAVNIITVGELSLDLNKKLLKVRNTPFVTTSSEYKIIELMFRNKGNIVSKENLMGYLYNPDEDIPHKKILDVFFCKLRRRIAAIVGEKQYIKTYWGVGYKLLNIPPVEYVMDTAEDEINSQINVYNSPVVYRHQAVKEGKWGANNSIALPA